MHLAAFACVMCVCRTGRAVPRFNSRVPCKAGSQPPTHAPWRPPCPQNLRAFCTWQQRLFLPEELLQYDGHKRPERYLALLGQVFDVTKGSKFYGADPDPPRSRYKSLSVFRTTPNGSPGKEQAFTQNEQSREWCMLCPGKGAEVVGGSGRGGGRTACAPSHAAVRMHARPYPEGGEAIAIGNTCIYKTW